MFKKSFITTTLLLSSMFAQNIDDVVQQAYEKNLTLKTLEKSLDVAKQEIELASKWKNPMLSFGANDIQFDEPTKRDKEPMQAQFIGFSQVFPLGNKLEIQKDIAINDYEISKFDIEDKQRQFKSSIYEYLYTIALLEQKIALFQKFKTNVSKIENLFKKLYEFNRASQVHILNAQIMGKELDFKQQSLKTALHTMQLKLEQILYEKVSSLNINTPMEKIVLSKEIQSHPKLRTLRESIQKFENIAHLEKEKKFSDVTFNMAYFQRDSKYEDYVNFSVAIPLSIYGTEDIQSRKANFKKVELTHKLQDVEKIFENTIETFQQKMDDALLTYSIIKKEILPQYTQLQHVLQTYNSTNAYKNIDTKTLIDNLNETIKYELMAIDEKQKFFDAYSKSKYFTKD